MSLKKQIPATLQPLWPVLPNFETDNITEHLYQRALEMSFSNFDMWAS
jgi:hypothetical protein